MSGKMSERMREVFLGQEISEEQQKLLEKHNIDLESPRETLIAQKKLLDSLFDADYDPEQLFTYEGLLLIGTLSILTSTGILNKEEQLDNGSNKLRE